MPNPSVFDQEWRDCLRAHYTQVVRNQDTGTERSLHGVMLEAGFREDEIAQLYVQATAHVDDVGADFVPDMGVVAAVELFVAPAVVAPEPEPVAPELEVAPEVDAPEAMEAAPADAEVEAEIPVAVVKDLVDEEEATIIEDAPEDVPADEEPPGDDPDITQLSMF